MKTIVRREPFVINKNLGSPLLTRTEDLTSTNSDGLPVVPFTERQKYDFDRNGWLLIPGVLPGNELGEMQAFAERLHRDPESIPEPQRNGLGGPLQALADHPIVVGFLNEFLAYPPLTSENSYGFRMETSSLRFRSKKEDVQGKFSPHNGNGLFRPPWDSHYYRSVPGKSWSGLTRVVWELNPVKKGCGGTLLLTSSHKAAYPAPETARQPDSPLWDTYECPAGSLLLFTEALSHSATEWTDEEGFRLAIFNLYNTITNRWSDWLPHPDLLASMPEKRQSLFRETAAPNNVRDGSFKERTSAYLEEQEG
jgi:hypothetical protein